MLTPEVVLQKTGGILFACILALCLAPAHADSIWGSIERPDETEVEMEEEIAGVRMGGRIELSFQEIRRSTRQTIFNSRFLLGAAHGDWGHALELRANSASDADQTTAERYQVNFKSEYSIDDDDYVFGAINSEKNRIQNIDRRTVEAVGYGRRVLRTDIHSLDMEIGLGARQVKFRDETPRESVQIVRLGLDYEWNINESANLSQTVQVDAGLGGGENTRTESITSLSAALVGELALTLSYEVIHNSRPTQADQPNTETITSVGLSYRF
jgi:putative salt-induced outer membrane protein